MSTRGRARAPALAAAMAARCLRSLPGFLCSAHTCTAWVTVDVEDASPPTVTRAALGASQAAAAAATPGARVADARMVRGGRRAGSRARRASSWGPRPRPSILSASSSTMEETLAD